MPKTHQVLCSQFAWPRNVARLVSIHDELFLFLFGFFCQTWSSLVWVGTDVLFSEGVKQKMGHGADPGGEEKLEEADP